MHLLQSLSDQGNLSNLTAFMNNTVLLVVAGVHVTNLARSALEGDAGKHAISFPASRFQSLSMLLCKSWDMWLP